MALDLVEEFLVESFVFGGDGDALGGDGEASPSPPLPSPREDTPVEFFLAAFLDTLFVGIRDLLVAGRRHGEAS